MVEDSQWISGLWLIVIIYHGFAVVKTTSTSQDQILQTIDTKIRWMMQTLWHGNSFHITDPFFRGTSGFLLPVTTQFPSQRPVMHFFQYFFVMSFIKHLKKQLSGQLYEMPLSSCNITVMSNCVMNEEMICGFLWYHTDDYTKTHTHIHMPWCNL